MLCRALVVTLAIGPAALPVATQAYDLKPKTPRVGVLGKTAPGHSGHLVGFHR